MNPIYILLGVFLGRIAENSVLKQDEAEKAEGKTNMKLLMFMLAMGYTGFMPFNAVKKFQGLFLGAFAITALDYVSEMIQYQAQKTGKDLTGFQAMLVNEGNMYVNGSLYVQEALYVTKNLLQDIEQSSEYELMNINCNPEAKGYKLIANGI